MSETVDHEVFLEHLEVTKRLELSEVRSSGGTTTTTGTMSDYTWLLAYHFYRVDPTKALYLWNRLPKVTKEGHPEFEAVYQVGTHIILRDMHGFHKACNAFEWTPKIDKMITKIIEKTRRHYIHHIDTEYGSISKRDLGILLGLSGAEVKGVVARQPGWKIEKHCCSSKMIIISGGKDKPCYHYQRKYTGEDVRSMIYAVILIGLIVIFWVAIFLIFFLCKC